MSTGSSDNYARHAATNADIQKVPVNQWGAVDRNYYFSVTAGSVGSGTAGLGSFEQADVANLVFIPGAPTGVRINLEKSTIAFSASPLGLVNLGVAAHTNINGSAIGSVSSALAVMHGSLSNAAISLKSMVLSWGASVEGQGKRSLLVDAKGGITVYLVGSNATSVFSLATNAVIRGCIVAG